MIEIQNNNNNDLKSNKKIKYEISKPNYITPSNADKLLKNIPDKPLNNLQIQEKGGLTSLNKNNLNNNKKNLRFDKKQNSARKRIKDKDNKNKLKPKNSIEKKKPNNNHVKSPKIILKTPVNKSKLHKRINSLHINGKENKKNLKTVNNKKDFNLNMINYYKEKINNVSIDKNSITIEQSVNQKENNNNNNMSKNIDLAISSSNNLSFSSENKKSTKYDNSSLTNKIYNNPIHIDEIEKNDLYFSFNNNYVSGSLSENDRKKINLKQNSQINNDTLSGKIDSRYKNLNKILEENFNNLKIERKEKEKEKEKEKNIKNEEKSCDKYDTLNPKNISINELVYNSINNGKKNQNSKNKFTKQKEKENKTLSSDLVQKKRKMQHKTASLNRSLELRKKNKISDNFIHNDLNNKNNNNVEKKTMKLFSKNDFRQMNTSPFVRSKPPIKPRQTNYLPGKTSLKKYNNNNNMKTIDKKYNSPQKYLNMVKGYISIDSQTKNNTKKPILTKKKKIVGKRKNKSMIIDNKIKDIEIDKNNNEEKKDNKANNKSKIEKNNKNNNSLENSSNKERPINIKKPIRAQSQQEINKELILNNINDILEKNQKGDIENNPSFKRSKKKILKLQTLCKKGFAGPGVKKTNQDNFFIYNNFNNNPNYIYLGVCDGHGMFGQDVSGYLVNTLPQNMNINLINSNINLSTESSIKLFPIILSTFVSTNIDMTEDERVDSSFSGSTCVSLFFTPERLICANVGDSRCILGKFDGNKWKSKNLSRDQKPSEKDESERIINSGGRIESFKDENGNYIGPERVWLKDEDVPGLAMSRSFGDEIAHTVGVITDPEINEYFFLEEDKFMIIASDGLWEFISSEECVKMVKEFYLKDDIEGALNYLYKKSSKRWIMEEEVIDDITILMAFLN